MLLAGRLRWLHGRWSGALHRLALVARRVALSTQAGPARPLWRGLYELLARGIGWMLTAGQPRATVYVAASLADGTPVYGLSDIDLVVVTGDVESARRRRRWLGRLLPPAGALISDLATYTPAELEEAASASTFSPGVRSVYLGRRPNRDGRGLRERPGLTRPTADWRRLRGPEQRPALPFPSAQQLRIAAWLELQFWWRQAMRVAAHDLDQHSAYTCVKLVNNGARVWLALTSPGHATSSRLGPEALLEHLPEEEPALRGALKLSSCLSRIPDEAEIAPLLAAFARLTARTVETLQSAAREQGTVEVVLAGVPAQRKPSEDPLPLVDWRGVVLATLPDETLAPMPGNPGDRAALAAAVRAAGPRRYGALRSGDLLVLAAGPHWTRSFLRGVACPATDPVSFALLGDGQTARFPRLDGWTVHDLARRAVTEHRGWLNNASLDATLSDREWLDGRMLGAPGPVRIAAKLLSAGRAVLLHDTLSQGSPQLPVAIEAIAAGLAERHPATRTAAEEVAGAYIAGTEPAQRTLRALCVDLQRLPVYAAEAPPRSAPDALAA